METERLTRLGMKSRRSSLRDSSWNEGNLVYGLGTRPSRVTTARRRNSRSSTLSGTMSRGALRPLCAQTPPSDKDTLPRVVKFTRSSWECFASQIVLSPVSASRAFERTEARPYRSRVLTLSHVASVMNPSVVTLRTKCPPSWSWFIVASSWARTRLVVIAA